METTESSISQGQNIYNNSNFNFGSSSTINKGSSSIIQDSLENAVFEQQKEQNNQRTQVSLTKSNKQKICQVQNIQILFKQPQEQNIFLMYGDLLLETNKDYYDSDYILQICNTYLQKKRVVGVIYDKSARLIEMVSENMVAGSTNFNYVFEILMRSQNNRNYGLAQELFQYEQTTLNQRINYERFFMENDEDLIYKAQQDFFERTKQDFKQILQQNEHDFYSYLFYSYIDKLELGFPIQKEQGINEAVCALFGCDQFQVVELMQRYGFIEHILKRGFPKDMQDIEPYGHFYMMKNLDYFITQTEIFNEELTAMTVDGIHFKMRMILKQITQIYKGMVLSNFYYSQYQLDNEELEKILSIRQKGSHTNSSLNILDLLLQQNIYSIYARKFGNYITNHKNFEPKLLQDYYPEKTCKYKIISDSNNS